MASKPQETKKKQRSKSRRNYGLVSKSLHRLPTKFVKECGFIPVVLINTAAVIEKYIKTKEIFQTQGKPSKAFATLNQLSLGCVPPKPLPHLTVHDAVEALKLVLVSLPEALVPEDVCDALITASRQGAQHRYGSILARFRSKSPLNFGILHFMMILLRKVSRHTQHNLMDVRKLATIFVLDVIKPLKLDDPNDGKFLSERMQRLPYLIMVVEKLIHNVEIFRNVRAKKPDADSSAGAQEPGFSQADRTDRNESKPSNNQASSIAHQADHPSVMANNAEYASYLSAHHALTAKGKGDSGPCTIDSKVELQQSDITTRTRAASVGDRGSASSFRCSSTRPSDQSTSNSDSTLQSLGVSKSSHGNLCPSQHPSAAVLPFDKIESLPPTKYISYSMVSPDNKKESDYFAIEVHDKDSAHIINPRNEMLGGICVSGNLKSGKQRTQSTPPVGQQNENTKRQGKGAKIRTASCNATVSNLSTNGKVNSDKVMGPSPVKKRVPAKRKTGTLKDDNKHSKLAFNLRLGNSQPGSVSLGRRRRKKKNGEPTKQDINRSDRLSFQPDELISPWVPDEATSDDSSLMTRSICNPRVLMAVTPEVTTSPSKTRRNRISSRQSNRSVSSCAQRPASVQSEARTVSPVATFGIEDKQSEYQFQVIVPSNTTMQSHASIQRALSSACSVNTVGSQNYSQHETSPGESSVSPISITPVQSTPGLTYQSTPKKEGAVSEKGQTEILETILNDSVVDEQKCVSPSICNRDKSKVTPESSPVAKTPCMSSLSPPASSCRSHYDVSGLTGTSAESKIWGRWSPPQAANLKSKSKQKRGNKVKKKESPRLSPPKQNKRTRLLSRQHLKQSLDDQSEYQCHENESLQYWQEENEQSPSSVSNEKPLSSDGGGESGNSSAMLHVRKPPQLKHLFRKIGRQRLEQMNRNSAQLRRQAGWWGWASRWSRRLMLLLGVVLALVLLTSLASPRFAARLFHSFVTGTMS